MGNGNVRVLPTGPFGGELLGQWWQQVLALPASQTEPLGLRIAHGAVLAPVETGPNQTISCTLRAGTPVLIVSDTAECSTNEPPPFHGDTAFEQRTCALRELGMDEVVSSTLSIDGGPSIELDQRRNLVVSPQERAVFVAAGGAFPVTPGPGTFVAAGYQVFVLGLRPGHHVLSGGTVSTDGSTDSITLELTVTP